MRDHWTYSCDFIRSFVGPSIPRGTASALRKEIAGIIGMPDEELSKLLGSHFQSNEDAATSRFMGHLSATLEHE